MMRLRTAKHIKQCQEYRVPDMESPGWISQSKRVPLDAPDLDPTSIETEPSMARGGVADWRYAPLRSSNCPTQTQKFYVGRTEQ